MGKKRHALIMKMVLFTFLASLWGLTEFSGMAGVCMGNEPDVVLQKQDSGKEITVKAGQDIQIQLEGLGGTGYWWYVENLDARRMELLSEKTKSVSDGRVGGPVLGLWTFRAKEPGTVEIKMDYYRIWEGSAKAIDHFQIKMKIE
jgi:predicted secreted protein